MKLAGVEGFEPPMSESKSDALTNLATPLQTVGNEISSLSFLQSPFIEKNSSLISVGHKKSPWGYTPKGLLLGCRSTQKALLIKALKPLLLAHGNRRLAYIRADIRRYKCLLYFIRRYCCHLYFQKNNSCGLTRLKQGYHKNDVLQCSFFIFSSSNRWSISYWIVSIIKNNLL